MVNVGAFLPSYGASRPISRDGVLDLARYADDAGLAHVWVGDHFVWNVGMLSPLPTLAAVAAVTGNVRLGTGVYLMNLRHPTLTAKDAATIDVLSEGRLTLGVGVGGDSELEYEALGIDHARRGKRLEESVLAMRGLLAGTGKPYSGEIVELPAFAMEPRPVQNPVPVWIGGRAQAVIERAAAIADGWFPVWVSADRFGKARETVEARRGGLAGFALALNVFIAVANTREEARKTVADHMGNAYGLAFETFEKYAAFGSADDVADFLQRYLDAGATDLALNLTGPDPAGQLSRIIETVLPKIGWHPGPQRLPGSGVHG